MNCFADYLTIGLATGLTKIFTMLKKCFRFIIGRHRRTLTIYCKATGLRNKVFKIRSPDICTPTIIEIIVRNILDWNPQCLKRIGRARKTWQRSMNNQTARLGNIWNEPKHLVKNRTKECECQGIKSQKSYDRLPIIAGQIPLTTKNCSTQHKQGNIA